MDPAAHVFTPWQWLGLGLSAGVIGLNKGGLTGVGIIVVIFFATLLPARESTGLVLPLLVIGDLFGIVVYRKAVRWDILARMIPPTLLGVILGYLVMDRISARAFGPLIGWIVLGLAALQLARTHLGPKLDHIFESRFFAVFMGLLAGTTTMIANAAGPVAQLYFLSARLPKLNLIGTTAWTFFLVNLFKLPFSAAQGLINPFSLHLALLLGPLVLLGCFAGRFVAAAMPEKLFNDVLMLCTILGALRLVW